MRLPSGRTSRDAGSPGAGWAGPVRKEGTGRKRTARAAEATSKENFTRPGKTVNTEHSKWFPALSTAKYQSEPPLWYPLTSWPYGHPILHTKPFHLQYRPQHTVREINTPAPDLQGPGLALSGSIWAVWKWRPPDGGPVTEAETGLWEPWVTPPPFLWHYTVFPSLNFMCNQQSRQEKQASLTHTRENADLSILLITPNLSKCK